MQNLVWKEFDKKHIERSVDWYWGVSVIGVGGVVVAIITGNGIVGLFVFVATIALLLQAIKKPQETTYAITNKGVVVGKSLYPYNTLESFWIEEEEEPPLLLLQSNRQLSSLIAIPIHEEIHHDDIRDMLLDYIDEEELREPLGQKIMEYLGF